MLRIIENSRLNKANVAEVDNAAVCAIREGITTSLLLCATEENTDCNEYSREIIYVARLVPRRDDVVNYIRQIGWQLSIISGKQVGSSLVEECRTTDGGIFINFFLCRGYLHSNPGLYPLLYTSFGRKRI